MGVEEALESGSARRRVEALNAVIETDRRDLLPQTIPMLNDPNPVVRSSALRAVRALTDWRFDYRPYEPEAARRRLVRDLMRRLDRPDAD